jgi:uncharacterized alpha/beta hydrolase family protein
MKSMKKYILFIIGIILIGAIIIISSHKTEATKDTLIAFQKPANDSNGIIYKELTIRWTDGIISNMHIEVTLKDKDPAEQLFNELNKEFGIGSEHNLELTGNIISYDQVDLSPWINLSYNKMRATLIEDGEWTIKEFNKIDSGEN